MQVELFKKKGTYLQDGQDKYFTRFYLKCGDSLIPVEPTYFSRKDEDGNDLRDYQYSGRKSVMEAFASELPDKEIAEQPKNNVQKVQNAKV